MELFQVSYEHSAVQLFRAYLRGVRKALNKGDVDLFKLYRKGYEVLRHEDSFEAYHRIYRKHILKQKLNYPAAKESQLIEQYRAKEEAAEQFVNKYQNELPSYRSYLAWLLLKLIAFDLAQVLGLGGSGILFISIGLWTMLYFGNSINIIGGTFLILLGLFLSKKSFVDFVRT